jgi:hypothetical protein
MGLGGVGCGGLGASAGSCMAWWFSPPLTWIVLAASVPDGILAGGGIPVVWETTSYLVVKTGGSWLVAAMNIHDQVPPEGCSTNFGLLARLSQYGAYFVLDKAVNIDPDAISS